MLQIYPKLNFDTECPYCLNKISLSDIAWQGIHVLGKGVCSRCKVAFAKDLPTGHATYEPYAVDLTNFTVFGRKTSSLQWFGKPLAASLRAPKNDNIILSIQTRRAVKKVIILNCLDYLYGHSVLKLLNAERHLNNLKNKSDWGLVVIVPKFLEWLIPQEVTEVWSVPIALHRTQNFYPSLHHSIEQQVKRFTEAYLSEAYSHPNVSDISLFSRTTPHVFDKKPYRVTFIWREDRPWFFQFETSVLARKTKLLYPLLLLQKHKVVSVFSYLRKQLPKAKFTVVGLGNTTSFPTWIADKRVTSFTPETEFKICKIYAESRVVVGVHGSSLLLPSAHAGMSISLIPSDRVGNFAQDTLYHPIKTYEEDLRLAAFRHRFLPIDITPKNLARNLESMTKDYDKAKKYFIA